MLLSQRRWSGSASLVPFEGRAIVDAPRKLHSRDVGETAKQVQYPVLYILPSVILIPIVVGAVFALSLMQLDFGFRLLMDGTVAIAVILVLGGLYWWGGKSK